MVLHYFKTLLSITRIDLKREVIEDFFGVGGRGGDGGRGTTEQEPERNIRGHGYKRSGEECGGDVGWGEVNGRG